MYILPMTAALVIIQPIIVSAANKVALAIDATETATCVPTKVVTTEPALCINMIV